jgi:hypothetical protein
MTTRLRENPLAQYRPGGSPIGLEKIASLSGRRVEDPVRDQMVSEAFLGAVGPGRIVPSLAGFLHGVGVCLLEYGEYVCVGGVEHDVCAPRGVKLCVELWVRGEHEGGELMCPVSV